MNDHSAPDPSIQVKKRDGSIEPFVLAKLLRSIRLGLSDAGQARELDTSTAGNLGEAVYDYLRSNYRRMTIHTRQLSELVELVLNQTGHSAASLAIREFHRRREHSRRRVMVAIPRPDGRYTQHRWNKGSVIQFLRRQHLLDMPASRMIAGRVEQLVFGMGLRLVTGGLVREVIESELLAWGLLPAALTVKKRRTPQNAARGEGA